MNMKLTSHTDSPRSVWPVLVVSFLSDLYLKVGHVVFCSLYVAFHLRSCLCPCHPPTPKASVQAGQTHPCFLALGYAVQVSAIELEVFVNESVIATNYDVCEGGAVLFIFALLAHSTC